MDYLKFSEAEIEKVDVDTKNQSKNKKWFEGTRKRITTNFYSVMTRSTTNPTRLVKQLLGYTSTSTRAMKFGIQMETRAAKRYMELISSESKGFILRECRLRVSRELPFIGASVDGILLDREGIVVKLLELKNRSTWNMTITEAAMKLPCLILE